MHPIPTSQHGCTHLILDLRLNQGGTIRYGQQLLSYLLDEPISIVASYQKVKGSAPDLRTVRGPADRPHRFLDSYVKPTIEERLLQRDPILNRAIGNIR